METPIVALPPECLYHVFSYLPISDRLKLHDVCKQWRAVDAMYWCNIGKLTVKYHELATSWSYINIRKCNNEIILTTNQCKIADDLIHRCGRYLTSFTGSSLYRKISLSKAIRYCENLEELIVTIRSAADDRRLCDLFRNNNKLKWLSLDFKTEKFYRCLQFVQAGALEGLIIARSFFNEPPHQNMVNSVLRIIRDAKSLKNFECDLVMKEELQYLGEKAHFKSLSMNYDVLTPSETSKLKPILNLKNLRSLVFAIYVGHTVDNVIAAIVANCLKLKKIIIEGNNFITNESIIAISKLPQLNTLEIHTSDYITDQFLWQLNNVERLSIVEARKVRDPGVITLLRASQTIQSLQLLNTSTTAEVVIIANEEVKKRGNGIPLTLKVERSIVTNCNLLDKSPFLTLRQ